MSANFNFGAPNKALNIRDLAPGDVLIQAIWDSSTRWEEIFWTVEQILKRTLVLTRPVAGGVLRVNMTVHLNGDVGYKAYRAKSMEDNIYLFTLDDTELTRYKQLHQFATKAYHEKMDARALVSDFGQRPSIQSANRAIAGLQAYIAAHEES